MQSRACSDHERPRGIRLVREPTAPHLLSTPPARTRAPLPLIVALAVFAAIIAAYVLAGRRLPPGVRGPMPESARQTAPRFNVPSLRGPERVKLADLRERIVVINFFASWCDPCALEAADLQRTWVAVRDRNVVFVGMATQDQEPEARAFLAKHAITYPAGFDTDGAVMRAYRITGIPTTIVIDGDGRLTARHAGIFVGDEGRARLLALIESARAIQR